MPAAATAAHLPDVLRARLFANGKRLLPCRASHKQRRLLSRRTNAAWHRLYDKNSDQIPAAKLLRRGFRAHRAEWEMLPSRQCDDGRHVLSGPGRSGESRLLPGADSKRHEMRAGLYQNARRLMLQERPRQPGWEELRQACVTAATAAHRADAGSATPAAKLRRARQLCQRLASRRSLHPLHARTLCQ